MDLEAFSTNPNSDKCHLNVIRQCITILIIDFCNGLEGLITAKDSVSVVQWFHAFTPTTVLSGDRRITNRDFSVLDRKLPVANMKNQVRSDGNFVKCRGSPHHNDSGHNLRK